MTSGARGAPPVARGVAAFLRGKGPVRVGLALVVAAYVAGALFGIAGPLLWGHHGYHAATYMLRAVMTLRFHVVTPCNWAGYEFPPRFSWYFHHPIGYHHLLVPFVWLFGAREWLARALAAAGGLTTLWALYVLVRRHWTRELGLLAAAVWVAMPFVTQYAVLLDPMLPTMALTLVALDAFLRFWDEPRARYLAHGCLAFAGAGLLMWDGYFEAFFLGLVALARLAGPAGRRARLVFAASGTARWRRWNAPLLWLVATGLASAATMAFHFWFTWKVGMMADFSDSFGRRHAAGFDYVYGREQEWALLLLGRPLLIAGLLWMTLFVARVAAGQARRRDVAVATFLVVKTFYIYLFREAAAVHEYRIDWYSLALTLAVVDLVADLGAFIVHLGGAAPLARPLAGLAMALAALALLRHEVPLGYKKLVESRETMGTDLPGYNADYPKQLFAREVARRTGPEDFVFTLTTGFPRRIEFYFYMDRSNVDVASLAQVQEQRGRHGRPLLILNPAAVSAADRVILLDLLRRHPADVYDGFMLVDLRREEPGIHEYAFVAQPMSPLHRYFVSHRYPPMRAAPSTSTFLECLYADSGIAWPADLLPLPPLPSPTAEQAQCRANALLHRGDRAGADAVVTTLRAVLRSADRPLGPALRVVALRAEARRGADLWLRVEAPELLAQAPGLRLRLRAEPTRPAGARAPARGGRPPARGGRAPKRGAGAAARGTRPPPAEARPAAVLEQRVGGALAGRPPGWLHFERFAAGALPSGRFRVVAELLDYARPPTGAPPAVREPARGRHRRRPSRGPHGRAAAAGAPAPAAVAAGPRVAATADLGVIEIH